ncbi:MAG: hypothetical protein H6Q90_3034 [Deltaproteobacteria bacterium]|nr:hypothetical protein [Deltaproteobacteria bacterium]
MLRSTWRVAIVRFGVFGVFGLLAAAPTDATADVPEPAPPPEATPPTEPAPPAPIPTEPAPAPSTTPATKPAAAESGTKNLMGPIQLQWNVTGELALPGLLGLHVRANAYAPGLPIYVGASAATFFGTAPSHLADERSGFLTRSTMDHNLYEVRAGLSIGGWTRRRLTSYTSYTHGTGCIGSRCGTLVSQNDYEGSYVSYTRRTLFAGYRRRATADVCPADSLPEDCGDLAPDQFMIGYLSMFATDSVFDSAEGRLHLKRSKTWDIHLLYTPGTDYSRTTMAKRFGAEIEVTFGGAAGMAIVVGGGWDGEVVLLTMAMGVGKPQSFTGSAPANDSIKF